MQVVHGEICAVHGRIQEPSRWKNIWYKLHILKTQILLTQIIFLHRLDSINFAFYAKYMDVVFVTINMIINYIL